MPEYIKTAVQGMGVEQEEHSTLTDDLIRTTVRLSACRLQLPSCDSNIIFRECTNEQDILYVTRIQRERFASLEDYEVRLRRSLCFFARLVSYRIVDRL